MAQGLTKPTVTANAGTGTFAVRLDPGYTLGKVDAGVGTFAVSLDPGHELGNIGTLTRTDRVMNVVDGTLSLVSMAQRVNNLVDGTLSLVTMVQRVNNIVNGTISVQNVSGGTLAVNVGTIAGTTAIYLHSTAGTLGVNVGTIAGTTAVYIHSSAGTIAANIGTISGTATVRFDPGYTLGKLDQGVKGTAANAWFTQDIAATAVIPNFSAGQVTGVSVSGNTIAAPAASASRKVYAYSLTTSATLSNIVANFTNGAGTTPTKYSENWLNGTIAGASVTPPGYLWAVPANTTLSLLISNAAGPVHYSVYWFNEAS